MAKTFESMEDPMPAPNGSPEIVVRPEARLAELGIVLLPPPTPLGAYVESAEAGCLLFLSGTLPVVNRKLIMVGRLGQNLSVEDGRRAARVAALNSLAAAKEHLGELSRIERLVKLTVLIATTESFTDHAAVADGASDLFVRLFDREVGHTRLVQGVQSLPAGAPVVVDATFKIKPVRRAPVCEERPYLHPPRFLVPEIQITKLNEIRR
jgi:enamine deaminase RidA (YjgF/YER057c/UK114 family)